jgi:hypothetical protein
MLLGLSMYLPRGLHSSAYFFVDKDFKDYDEAEGFQRAGGDNWPVLRINYVVDRGAPLLCIVRRGAIAEGLKGNQQK